MIGRAGRAAGGQYNDGETGSWTGLRYGEVMEAAGTSTDPAGFRGCSVYKLKNLGAVPEKFVG